MVKRVHFESFGEGPEIVICNGLSQSTANWRGIARQNPGYRWLLFDARGCGKSPLGPRPYRLEDHVDDLLWVLDQCAAKQPLLLGFSHGGRVATQACARFPERFSGLVLVSVGAAQTVRRRAHITAWRRTLELGGLRAMAWSTLPTIVGRKLLERFGDWELLVNGTVTRNSQEGLEAMFEGMSSYPPLEQDARQVKLPTLVVYGNEDPLVDQHDCDLLCAWTGGSAMVFDACGHTLPLEEPDQFIQVIADFLAKSAMPNRTVTPKI